MNKRIKKKLFKKRHPYLFKVYRFYDLKELNKPYKPITIQFKTHADNFKTLNSIYGMMGGFTHE